MKILFVPLDDIIESTNRLKSRGTDVAKKGRVAANPKKSAERPMWYLLSARVERPGQKPWQMGPPTS